MTDAAARTLEEMANRPTSYAVDLIADDAHVRRLAFTAKKTKRAIIEIAFENGEEIAALLTEAELDQDWSYSKGAAIFAGGRVQVRIGKTERDVASEIIRAAA